MSTSEHPICVIQCIVIIETPLSQLAQLLITNKKPLPYLNEPIHLSVILLASQLLLIMFLPLQSTQRKCFYKSWTAKVPHQCLSAVGIYDYGNSFVMNIITLCRNALQAWIERHYTLKVPNYYYEEDFESVFRTVSLRDSLLQFYCLAFIFSSLSNTLDFFYNVLLVLTNEKRADYKHAHKL